MRVQPPPIIFILPFKGLIMTLLDFPIIQVAWGKYKLNSNKYFCSKNEICQRYRYCRNRLPLFAGMERLDR